MRWFKFMCDESEAQFDAWLVDSWGMEGYGRWVAIQKVVAREMKRGSNDCTASYSVARWCSFLAAKPNKLDTFLTAIEEQGEIFVERSGNVIRIAIPNLLKKRDEYTARSGDDDERSTSDAGASRAYARSASVSGSLFPLEEPTPKREDRNTDSLSGAGGDRSQKPVKKTRRLSDHQLAVKAVEDAFAEFGAPAPAPQLIAKWNSEFGLEEVLEVVRILGPPGHLQKGAPYTYATLKGRQSDNRNDQPATGHQQPDGRTGPREARSGPRGTSRADREEYFAREFTVTEPPELPDESGGAGNLPDLPKVGT